MQPCHYSSLQFIFLFRLVKERNLPTSYFAAIALVLMILNNYVAIFAALFMILWLTFDTLCQKKKTYLTMVLKLLLIAGLLTCAVGIVAMITEHYNQQMQRTMLAFFVIATTLVIIFWRKGLIQKGRLVGIWLVVLSFIAFASYFGKYHCRLRYWRRHDRPDTSC